MLCIILFNRLIFVSAINKSLIMNETHQKNIAALIHLSTFLRFIIPFGNILSPLLLWLFTREKSPFVDANGKQALNFQISFLLYTIIFGALTLPFLIFAFFGHISFFDINSWQNIQINWHQSLILLVLVGAFGMIAVVGYIFEIICVIIASVKASDGVVYKYPLTITFLK